MRKWNVCEPCCEDLPPCEFNGFVSLFHSTIGQNELTRWRESVRKFSYIRIPILQVRLTFIWTTPGIGTVTDTIVYQYDEATSTFFINGTTNNWGLTSALNISSDKFDFDFTFTIDDNGKTITYYGSKTYDDYDDISTDLDILQVVSDTGFICDPDVTKTVIVDMTLLHGQIADSIILDGNTNGSNALTRVNFSYEDVSESIYLTKISGTPQTSTRFSRNRSGVSSYIETFESNFGGTIPPIGSSTNFGSTTGFGNCGLAPYSARVKHINLLGTIDGKSVSFNGGYTGTTLADSLYEEVFIIDGERILESPTKGVAYGNMVCLTIKDGPPIGAILQILTQPNYGIQCGSDQPNCQANECNSGSTKEQIRVASLNWHTQFIPGPLNGTELEYTTADGEEISWEANILDGLWVIDGISYGKNIPPVSPNAGINNASVSIIDPSTPFNPQPLYISMSICSSFEYTARHIFLGCVTARGAACLSTSWRGCITDTINGCGETVTFGNIYQNHNFLGGIFSLPSYGWSTCGFFHEGIITIS